MLGMHIWRVIIRERIKNKQQPLNVCISHDFNQVFLMVVQFASVYTIVSYSCPPVYALCADEFHGKKTTETKDDAKKLFIPFFVVARFVPSKNNKTRKTMANENLFSISWPVRACVCTSIGPARIQASQHVNYAYTCPQMQRCFRCTRQLGNKRRLLEEGYSSIKPKHCNCK